MFCIDCGVEPATIALVRGFICRDCHDEDQGKGTVHVYAEPTIVRRFPLDSSVIAEAGYDGETLCAELTFRSGERPVWRYYGIAAPRFVAFLTAVSPGSYYSKEIRGHFLSVKVAPRAPAPGCADVGTPVPPAPA